MTLPQPAPLFGVLPRLTVTPELPTISREWVLVPLQVAADGVEVVLTASGWPVTMGFVPGIDVETKPDPDLTWHAAEWTSERRRDGVTAYFARCLVGPGGTVSLPAGDYVPWLAWIAPDEQPVRPAAGPIRVF